MRSPCPRRSGKRSASVSAAAQTVHAATRRGGSLLLALILFSLQSPDPVFSQQETGTGTVMTLERQRDPLILRNDALGGLFDGESVKAVAVYAYGKEGFRPIPHQFDFIGEDGLVIPSHVNRVMEKAVYDFMPNEKLPDRLTAPYELLFMARDAGDRYPGDDLPPAFTRALEIRVEDPRGKGIGWVYLMKPESLPPAVRKDYVDYTLIRRGKQNIEQIKADGYVTGFPDADKPFAYGYWKIPPEAGGTGVDFLQTFRVRIKMKVLFWNIELDPKNNIIPYVIGYNNGPVRVTRRVFSSVVIKGIKMDRFMGDAKLETESHYYGSFFFFDGEVSLPGLVKKISKIKAMFTTDFSANATGMKWYNSPNAANGGCLVDGQMSPQEMALEKTPYQWTLIVGPQGGWGNILQMHTESVKPNMNLFYLDDSAYHNEKDPDLNGTWASTGYYLEKLNEAEDLVTFRTYILALPGSFQIPDTADLVNLVYHPLKSGTERSWKGTP
jgi:hypothetical protein